VAGDVESAAWELECTIVVGPSGTDLKGLQIQGSPNRRFIYLTWGVVDDSGIFTMFRRAKLWLDAVDPTVMTNAIDRGVLVGRLGLKDAEGWPLCASVRPPHIDWKAGTVRPP
jgi:hypothetical protein